MNPQTAGRSRRLCGLEDKEENRTPGFPKIPGGIPDTPGILGPEPARPQMAPDRNKEVE